MSRQIAESELIEAAIAGDRLAMDQLLHRHYDEVARHLDEKVPNWLAPTATTEDLLQETFAKAIRGLPGLRHATQAAFLTWLKTIADREVVDVLRAQTAQKRGAGRQVSVSAAAPRASSIADLALLLSDHGESPSQNVARREAVRAVQISMAGLPDQQREAIRMRYLDGKSVSETAAKMRRTPGAIRGLVHRAKQSLCMALGRSSRWFTKK